MWGGDVPAIDAGGYTARRVEILKRGEGFRASDCGPVTVTDSFAYILGDTPDCGRDLHSDGVQGVYAKGMTIRNATIIFGNDCGTSPYDIGYGPGYPGRCADQHRHLHGGSSTHGRGRLRVPAGRPGLGYGAADRR